MYFSNFTICTRKKATKIKPIMIITIWTRNRNALLCVSTRLEIFASAVRKVDAFGYHAGPPQTSRYHSAGMFEGIKGQGALNWAP